MPFPCDCGLPVEYECWCGNPPFKRVEVGSGRMYYSCSLPEGNELRCPMKVWEDEAHLPGAFSPPYVSESDSESDDDLVEIPVGKCMCGVNACVERDPVIRKRFLCCHYPIGHIRRCNYFEWEDQCAKGDEMQPVFVVVDGGLVCYAPLLVRGKLLVFTYKFCSTSHNLEAFFIQFK